MANDCDQSLNNGLKNRASVKSSDYYQPAPVSPKRHVRVLGVVPLRARVVPLRVTLIKSIIYMIRFVKYYMNSQMGQITSSIKKVLYELLSKKSRPVR